MALETETFHFGVLFSGCTWCTGAKINKRVLKALQEMRCSWLLHTTCGSMLLLLLIIIFLPKKGLLLTGEKKIIKTIHTEKGCSSF